MRVRHRDVIQWVKLGRGCSFNSRCFLLRSGKRAQEEAVVERKHH